MKLQEYIKSDDWLTSFDTKHSALNKLFFKEMGVKASDLYGDNYKLAKNITTGDWYVWKTDGDGNVEGSDPVKVGDSDEYTDYLSNHPSYQVKQQTKELKDMLNVKKMIEEKGGINQLQKIINEQQHDILKNVNKVVEDTLNKISPEFSNFIKNRQTFYKNITDKLGKKLGVEQLGDKVGELQDSLKNLSSMMKPDKLLGQLLLKGLGDADLADAIVDILMIFL